MKDEKIIDIITEGEFTLVSFLVPSISGACDFDGLGESLRGFIVDNKPDKVIVDFAGVKFFSSQVLGLLVDVWRMLKEYDGRVAICGITPELSRVFKITNLDRLFEFYPDKQSAVEALGT